MTQKAYVAKAIYTLSDGIAPGTISLAETTSVPEGAIVYQVVTNETTALGGSSDIDIQVGTQKVATGIDFTGTDSGLTVNPGTLVPLAVTAAADIQIDNDDSSTITGAGATVEIFVFYLLG